MADIELGRGVRIPEGELDFRVSRSSGPGGQGVNTTDSKVELRFNVEASEALTPEQKARLRRRLENRMTKDGVLILQSSEHRSQHQNRDAAIARFKAIVSEALEPPKRRRKTRPTRGSKERRLKNKKRRSEVKKLRQSPPKP